jgi:hypothetical protein
MNAFILSLRYIRSRKLESSLAIFGIVLGVATLAGTLSLISSYRSYYDKFSRSPESRQVSVMQATRVRVTDDAAVLIGATEIENVRFTADEVKGALDVCPDVDSFYQSEFRTFRTTASTSTSTGFGGPGGMMMGGAPENASAGAGATASGGETPGGDAAAPAAPAAGDGPPDGDMPPDGGGMFGRQAEIDTTIEKPTLEEINGAMVSGGFFNAYSLVAKYGDVLSDSGDNSGTPGVVLGASLAEKLYASATNPSDLIGKKLILNYTTYNIVGVLEYDEWNSSSRNSSHNDMAFVPTSAMRSGAASRMRFGNVTYTVKGGGTPAQAAIQLESYFNSIHGEGAVVAEANLERFSKEVTKRERILTLMAILASASALTAAINLFNLMTSRVMRRRRPIAIMRAVGAWNAKVFRQIMVEAGIIGVTGALGGIALSPVVVGTLGSMLENGASNQSIPVSVNAPVLALVGVGALLVSLAFAAIPAKSGSSLVITDALRSE